MTTQARELAKIVTNAGDINLVDDISLASDGAVLNFGADNDVTLTHVADTALLLNSSRQLQFGDSGTYIHQSADGVLDLVADTEIEINATTVDINNTNCNIDGTLTVNNLTVNGTTSGISSSPAADDISTGDAAVTIGTSSGSITLDSPADIILDADSDSIKFKDGGTEYGKIYGASDNFYLNAATQDKDIIFVGDDGGSSVTALTLDMSEGGIAEFAAQIRAPSQATSAPTFAFTNDTDTGISRPTTNALNLITAGSERVRITSAGNVIVGATSDSAAGGKFQIQATKSLTAGIPLGMLTIEDTASMAAGVGGSIVFTGAYLSDGTKTSLASIEGYKENGTSGEYGGAMYFKTREDGGNATEKMRITSNKGVYFGGTPYAATTYDHTAVFTNNSVPNGVVVIEDSDVSSGIGNTCLNLFFRDEDPATNAVFIDFRDGGGRVGSVLHNDDGNGVTYGTGSDYRLKENVDYNWDGTTLLKQLKPAKFNFIGKPNTIRQGFLAHEVMDIVPGSVSGSKDQMEPIGTIKDSNGNTIHEGVYEHFCKTDEGQTWTQTGTQAEYQQLDYSRVVPLLVKTIQELEARITTLEG
tara:strand:- start:1946 stop:3706 length:1761 start_codon:yes stop_codon:yes gene_type:complete